MIRPFRGDFALTQPFGANPGDYAKFGLNGHNGLDYGLPSNTQVIAPHDGKVIEAASDPTGYGNYLKIENAREGSVMAHLASFQVKVGDTVSEGQPIGLSDNTGNSTGPHLHWGYYLFPRIRTNGYAGFINQLPLLTLPSVPVLALPNPGYPPTFEGQTVERVGVLFQSYIDAGKLLWRAKPAVPVIDWEQKYHELDLELQQVKKEAGDRITKIKVFVRDA